MADDKITIQEHGGVGLLWVAGWLFTIGYIGLGFWQGFLALFLWPYFLGVELAPQIVPMPEEQAAPVLPTSN